MSDMLLNLEGFQYTTSLDLNMRYYHIRLSEETSNLTEVSDDKKRIMAAQNNFQDFYKGANI